jgi:5-methylcytosine-specific restriction protein A
MPWSPYVSAPHATCEPARSGYSVYYGTRMWKRVRMYKLRINQRCECCQERFSEEVHHRNSNADDNRPSNLLAVCKSCHSSITMSERVKKGR